MNLSIPLPIENNKSDFINGLENEKDTLSKYLKNVSYNTAFEYMFKTGEVIPVIVIGKLLNALHDYRISFYSVKDCSFSTYVVSSSTKTHIVKHLVRSQDEDMAISGSFKKHDARRRAKDALSDRLKLMDELIDVLILVWNEELSYINWIR